jgi:S-DNA-T family DNA segregation ATPase FtsK/SpoIIIE
MLVVQDPSLSHATSRPIRNILGYPGAIGADMMMQILGLGAIMLILPVAVWGWRMLTTAPSTRGALRLGCWLLACVLAAGFASCFKHGAPGRCRPASAAWSAMRWCARRPWCSAPPA